MSMLGLLKVAGGNKALFNDDYKIVFNGGPLSGDLNQWQSV